MSDLKIEKSRKAKKRIVIDSFMVFFIVISPFIFKAHEYFPRNTEEDFEFLGFIMDSNGFVDVSTYIWFLLGKIIPLYLLFIWFFTCKHWWYHAILIPITMYAFQLFEVVYSDDKYVDTENILWLLPVCMVVIPLVYFIRVKLYDKHVHGIDIEAMDAELSELKEKLEQNTVPEDKNKDADADLNKEDTIRTETLSEEINRRLSTGNIESSLKQLQHRLQDWLHFKF
ncbi:hypothetical protein [Maribacter sp. 2304DJ31-5]|uniref:hypothetical protein n=1 Tax=Maribacter sp. 2304DJ31-5 TaxID=3386273 RepID=UPI0039BCEEF6